MTTEEQDMYFMQQALLQAQEAAAIGEVPVGAIIVKDGNIVAKGFNTRHHNKDPLGHAELDVIRKAAEHIFDWRLEGHTIYVTLEPCPMCAGAIYSSRIERCVFGAYDPKAGFVGSLFNINSIHQLNHHFEVTGGVLENECAVILRDFFSDLRSVKRSKKGSK